MSTKRIIKIVLAVIFYIAFFAFIKAVKTVDLQPVGPQGSVVGFADFNMKCLEGFGQSEIWYEISQIIGWFAIIVCACFAVVGFLQLVKRKSLLKVDRDIICLGILYSICIAAYVIFLKVTINCRPVLEDGVLESSFPSSHTVLGVCVFTALLIEIKRRVSDPGRALIGEMFCAGMVLLAIIGRILSGMHWATDIIGGCILSAAFLFTFAAILPELTADGCPVQNGSGRYRPKH